MKQQTKKKLKIPKIILCFYIKLLKIIKLKNDKTKLNKSQSSFIYIFIYFREGFLNSKYQVYFN